MARLSLLQTNFTAGEISPRLAGRVDVDKYGNAAKDMTNCHPVIQGGAKRRAGSRFAGITKLSAATASRIIPFVVSKDLAYQLEFGNLYVRVWSPNGVYTGVELVSPYTAAQVSAIDFTQGADTMFVFHGSVFPQRIRSFSPAVWDLGPAPFTVVPFAETGLRPAATLTLGATSGAGVTATASVAVFLVSDVGRNIVSSAGIGTIVGFTSTTVVTINITTAFTSLTYTANSWNLDVSPQAFLAASADSPVGSRVTLSSSLTRAATLTLSAKTGAITATASAAIFAAGDVGKVLYGDSGVAAITAFTDSTHVNLTTSADFSTNSYASGAWGITGDAFRAGDVGSYVSINGGLLLITAVASTTSATATIITAFTSLVAAPPLAWSLNQSMWSATFGYPSTGTLYQQRLWCANSLKYPQTIWGSRTGLYLDFTTGAKDTDSCQFTIASDTVNPISYLASGRDLIVHTYGGEFTMSGTNGAAITPTNIAIQVQSTFGSKGVRPLTVGKESIFVQRSGRKLRAMSYQFAIDGYNSPDLAALAEHITFSGIVDMAYQQEPDGIMWLVLGDGTLVSCTLDRVQNVTGWAKHYTQGAVESVSSIPNGGSDQVWLIVRRTVNGSTVRYVEWLDPDFQPIYPATVATGYPPIAQPTVYGCTVDAGVVIDSATGVSVLTGLSHLEASVVDCVSDGSYMGSFTVTGGQITLPRTAKRSLVGLHFKSNLTMLTPEAGSGAGSSQGNSMSAREITMRFLNTVGASVVDAEGRNQDVPWRNFGSMVLNQPPPVFTGEVRIEAMGWERGRCEISIVQDVPLPMHLLSVVRKMSISD